MVATSSTWEKLRGTKSILNYTTRHLDVLFLFIKNDVKGFLIPVVSPPPPPPFHLTNLITQVLIYTLPSPNLTLKSFVQSTAWATLQLLQFCIANQSMSVEEDAQNKPYRPLPAGRITLEDARAMRWAMVPVCLALSAQYGVADVGMLFAVSTFLYNECHWDNHWAGKNLMNAIMYPMIDVGAAHIANSQS
jgi:hypothetical protein